MLNSLQFFAKDGCGSDINNFALTKSIENWNS